MGENRCGAYAHGVFRKGSVRISDLSGMRRLPIGRDEFLSVVEQSVFIDKTMLIADVLDGDSFATLYCRPRRFGKSLNLSMLQRFLEIPSPTDPAATDTAPLFENLAIWEAENGRYRAHHQAYPVIRLSFGAAKQQDWGQMAGSVAGTLAAEVRRHGYLLESEALLPEERSLLKAVQNRASKGDLGGPVSQALSTLARLLYKHHGRKAVILVDEYDAPVMAAHTHGFYREAVSFLKALLTGALKGNDAVERAVLTGVQRISKESIFSDLNNVTVNTSLSVMSDERYGFTDEEVVALADYLGAPTAVEEARLWYDGYRFGKVDVYNPWSVLNYFSNQCTADVYWGNTSSNSVLGSLVEQADGEAWGKLYDLMEPGGSVEEPLDLGIVFPDDGVPGEAVWSMLYLAGYLTTDDTEMPNSDDVLRALRVPNNEVRRLFRREIVDRSALMAGSRSVLRALHGAFAQGDAASAQKALCSILAASASFFDLTSENSYHMFLLGLLFGMPSYGDPVSNRESGEGRFDIMLEPLGAGHPPIVFELKHAKGADDATLQECAGAALAQIRERSYASAEALAFGISFSGKRCAVVCSAP